MAGEKWGGTGERRTVDQDSPVDAVVGALVQRCHNKGRGFVLSLDHLVLPVVAGAAVGLSGAREAAAGPGVDAGGEAAAPVGDDGVRRGAFVRVIEEPPTPDEWEPPAEWRNHTVEDVASFIAYAKKYGTEEKSLVFYNDVGAVLVLDDQVLRGDREAVSLAWKYSADFQDWRSLVKSGKALTHKDLLKFCIVHAHNLVDVRALDLMRSMKATTTVKFDSDLRDEGNAYAMAVTTAKGDELQKFPKELSLSLSVLDTDVGQMSLDKPVRVRIEVFMPERADQQVTFLLISPELDAAARARVNEAFAEVGEELQKWTICRGSPSWAERDVGVPG